MVVLTGVKSIPEILSARPIMLPRLVRALVAMNVVVKLGGVPWPPRVRMIIIPLATLNGTLHPGYYRLALDLLLVPTAMFRTPSLGMFIVISLPSPLNIGPVSRLLLR